MMNAIQLKNMKISKISKWPICGQRVRPSRFKSTIMIKERLPVLVNRNLVMFIGTCYCYTIQMVRAVTL